VVKAGLPSRDWEEEEEPRDRRMTAGDGRRLGRLVLWRDGGTGTHGLGRVRARHDVAVRRFSQVDGTWDRRTVTTFASEQQRRMIRGLK